MVPEGGAGKRLADKAEITGQLAHPGVVRICAGPGTPHPAPERVGPN